MRIILLALVASGLLAGPASAVTLVGTDGGPSRWQPTADRMRVPSVGERLSVIDGDCPWPGFETAWGCGIDDEAGVRVYLSPSIPRGERANTLWHELGHRFSTLLDEADRDRFRSLLGEEGVEWEAGEDSLEERFAVAYQVAARYGTSYGRLYPVPRWPVVRSGAHIARSIARRRLARYRDRLADARRFRRVGIEWEHGYRATPATNRAMLDLLDGVVARLSAP